MAKPMEKTGVLIIDNNINDCIAQRDLILAKCVNQNLKFYYAHSIEEGLQLLKLQANIRDSLCSIFIDQTLTSTHNPKLDTYGRNALREVEDAINRVKLPSTALCLYGDAEGLDHVSKELSRAQLVRSGKMQLPTQLINMADGGADAMLDVIQKAQALSNSGISSRIDDLSAQIQNLQNILSLGTDGNPSYLSQVKINEERIKCVDRQIKEWHKEIKEAIGSIQSSIAELSSRLESVADCSVTRNKILDSLLGGLWGKTLVGITVAILLVIFGVDISKLIEILKALF